MAIPEYFSTINDVQDLIVKEKSSDEDHEQARNDIIDALRKTGYSDTTLASTLITNDLRRASVVLANYYTCIRQTKGTGDIWSTKAEHYRELHLNRMASLEIAFDTDADGVIDEGEREIRTLRIIR